MASMRRRDATLPAMPRDEFPEVTSFHELLLLDEEAMAMGYQYGASGEPAPPQAIVGRAFWHGWTNGAAAAGTRKSSPEQLALRGDYAMRVHEHASNWYH